MRDAPGTQAGLDSADHVSVDVLEAQCDSQAPVWRKPWVCPFDTGDQVPPNLSRLLNTVVGSQLVAKGKSC